MKQLLIKFSAAVAGCLTLLAIGGAGIASAASISNTGYGSTNVIVGGGSGSISTTGANSVNIITNGCNFTCGNTCNCWWVWSCHHPCWHWQWTGNCWHWCFS